MACRVGMLGCHANCVLPLSHADPQPCWGPPVVQEGPFHGGDKSSEGPSEHGRLPRCWRTGEVQRFSNPPEQTFSNEAPLLQAVPLVLEAI